MTLDYSTERDSARETKREEDRERQGTRTNPDIFYPLINKSVCTHDSYVPMHLHANGGFTWVTQRYSTGTLPQRANGLTFSTHTLFR